MPCLSLNDSLDSYQPTHEPELNKMDGGMDLLITGFCILTSLCLHMCIAHTAVWILSSKWLCWYPMFWFKLQTSCGSIWQQDIFEVLLDSDCLSPLNFSCPAQITILPCGSSSINLNQFAPICWTQQDRTGENGPQPCAPAGYSTAALRRLNLIQALQALCFTPIS